MKESIDSYHTLLNMSARAFMEFKHASSQMSGTVNHDEFHSHINLKKDKFSKLIEKNIVSNGSRHDLINKLKGGRLKIYNENPHNETSFSVARVLQMLHENNKSFGGNKQRFSHKNDKYRRTRNIKNDYSRKKYY